MKSELKIITPKFAVELLKRNVGNRNVSRTTVDKLADDMVNGRWMINGETITYNKDRLMDGQHRLLACVKAGIPITSWVVEGINSDVFGSIGDTKSRSGGDVLAISGHKYAAVKSTTLIILESYMTGKIVSPPSYSNSKIIELAAKYDGIGDSISLCQNTKRLIPASQLSAMHYLFSKLDKVAADEFVDDLINGNNLDSYDGVYLLRERLVNNLYSKGKLHRRYIIALVIKAWNIRRRGKVCKRLSWSDNESFPEIE